MEKKVISYKPSAWYLRKAIRSAKTIEEAQTTGLLAVRELEKLKEWVRNRGVIPPKWEVTEEEAREKGWIS